MKKDEIISVLIGVPLFIIFVYIIYVCIDIYNKYNYDPNKLENLENISKYEKVCTNNDFIKIDKNKCSRKCCGLNQYQTEFLKEIDDNSEERKKYVGSNISCNFGDSSGCLCIPKEDYAYLSNRGINPSCYN
jgi:hypothetical protein